MGKTVEGVRKKKSKEWEDGVSLRHQFSSGTNSIGNGYFTLQSGAVEECFQEERACV